MVMRNIKTREGFDYWDKICSLKHYGFLHSPDGKRVVKTEGIGNWIDKHEAQQIVDQAQDEINGLRARLARLQPKTADHVGGIADMVSVPRKLLDDEGLEAIAELASAQEQTINIGQVQGDFDEHIESTAGYAVRLMRGLRALIATEVKTDA
jgi:hypothetical protein